VPKYIVLSFQSASCSPKRVPQTTIPHHNHNMARPPHLVRMQPLQLVRTAARPHIPKLQHKSQSTKAERDKSVGKDEGWVWYHGRAEERESADGKSRSAT